MKFEIKSVSDNEKILRVEISQERINEEFQSTLKELRNSIQLKGFRPGRVPYSILKGRFGDDIQAQIGAKLIEETYPEALKQSGLDVFDSPEINEWRVIEGEQFVYEAKLSVVQDFDLVQYTDLEVEKAKVEVTDEELETGLERIQDGQITYEVVSDRPVQKNDKVFGRVKITMDDNVVPGWGNRRLELEVGSGKFFQSEDIEEKLVGATSDAPVVVDYTFAEDYEYFKDFAGKSVTFEFTVSEIKEKSVPEINDDLAKDLGLDSLDDLKKQIHEDIVKRHSSENEEQFDDSIATALIEKNPFDVPERMIDIDLERMMEQFVMMPKDGAEEDEKMKEFKTSLRPLSDKNVRRRMILDKIAQLEKIEVSEDEIEDEFEKAVQESKADREELREKWEEHGMFEGLKKQIARDKAFAQVKEKVIIIEAVEPVDPPVEDSGEKSDDSSES